MAELAKIEAEKVEAEKRRADEEKRKKEEEEKECLRVEEADRKEEKCQQILVQFHHKLARKTKQGEKRKARVLDAEEEDRETPVPEGLVSNWVCLGVFIY